MSKLILNKLKTLKSLIKGKGYPYEKYGVVKDGILYFHNGVIQTEIEIDIPFDCCIDLFQLTTILQSIKGETVIVQNGDKVSVNHNNMIYNVETLPIDSITNMLYFNQPIAVECNAPYVFKEMCKFAESYTQPIDNPDNVNFIAETLLIYNNLISFTDKFNVVQATLDFAMPNLSFSLEQVGLFNKVVKSNDIVGMNLIGDYLLLQLDNGLKVYLKSLHNINPEKLASSADKVNNVLNDVWKLPTIIIPDFVKEQFELLNKLSVWNTIFFNNSFCQANSSQINYDSFTDEPIDFKCVYRHLHTAIKMGYYFKSDDKGLSFLSKDNLIRGFIGRVRGDAIR